MSVILENEKIPRYLRVYNYYKELILSGGLKSGTKLPSIRKGSMQLQMSRTTMESAYLLLAAEGYIVFDELNAENPININAFVRDDGKIGIRNDIWIINTVGCVNKIAKKLSELTGAKYFEHPFGCSQLGDDMLVTQLILKGLVNHPNAGGVLVLGLGCENGNINEWLKRFPDFDADRVKFLNCQDVDDELTVGEKILEKLCALADDDRRTLCDASDLVIGLKCGGSDGFSGITANALLGKFTDALVSEGGSAILTEVPEMFGAEQILMNRAVNKDVFENTVNLINNFKKYFLRYGEPVDENPSPGNKEGGITTLAEKSLGCVQKGGTAPVMDVLAYAEGAKEKGQAAPSQRS